MNIKTISALFIALAAAACATNSGPMLIWVNDKVSQEQFNRDRAECEFEAVRVVQPNTSLGIFTPLDTDSRRKEVVGACLRARDYYQQALGSS